MAYSSYFTTNIYYIPKIFRMLKVYSVHAIVVSTKWIVLFLTKTTWGVGRHFPFDFKYEV